MLKNIVSTFAHKVLPTLTMGILFSLSLISIFSVAYIPLTTDEKVVFHHSPFYYLLLLCLFFITLLLLRPKLKRIETHRLFNKCAMIYLILGSLLILNVVIKLRSDPYSVFLSSQQFAQKNYSSLTEQAGYLALNPHQLGLLFLNQIYYAILKSEHFIFFINLLIVLGNNWFLYRITDKLFNNKIVNNYCILLSFLFFPQFFFILFIYGSLPGLFCILVGFYALLNFHQNKQIFNLLFAAFFLTSAYLIRNNYIIFILAILIFEFLSFIIKSNWKKIAVISLLIITIPLSSFLLKSHYSHIIGKDIAKGTPMIAYIVMGLRDDPKKPSLGGWWDGYNSSILQKNNYSYEKANLKAQSDLAKEINRLLRSPVYTFKFFTEKIKSTWLEPTFQSFWSGPLPDVSGKQNNFILGSIYEEKGLFHLFNLFGLIFIGFIYLTTAFSLFIKRKMPPLEEVPFERILYLYFLGGFFFHLIWETKSQYAFVYVFLLIPMSANFMEEFGLLVKKFLLKKKQEKSEINAEIENLSEAEMH